MVIATQVILNLILCPVVFLSFYSTDWLHLFSAEMFWTFFNEAKAIFRFHSTSKHNKAKIINSITFIEKSNRLWENVLS